MGWFDKNKKEEHTLPDLPKLPELHPIEETKIPENEPLHQLPTFPNNSLGEKFSQNAIKEAVESDKHHTPFLEENKTQNPIKEQFSREISNYQDELKIPFRKEINETPEEFKEVEMKMKKKEPVFIRIDKFEETLEIFDNIKQKINEIEKMLQETKKIKEEEEKELMEWEEEIKKTKIQIEKIDQEIFSKVE